MCTTIDELFSKTLYIYFRLHIGLLGGYQNVLNQSRRNLKSAGLSFDWKILENNCWEKILHLTSHVWKDERSNRPDWCKKKKYTHIIKINTFSELRIKWVQDFKTTTPGSSRCHWPYLDSSTSLISEGTCLALSPCPQWRPHMRAFHGFPAKFSKCHHFLPLWFHHCKHVEIFHILVLFCSCVKYLVHLFHSIRWRTLCYLCFKNVSSVE